MYEVENIVFDKKHDLTFQVKYKDDVLDREKSAWFKIEYNEYGYDCCR